MQVRSLQVCGTSGDEIKNFEYSCLGEVRILSALKKHPCIVEIYGHQISSKWALSSDGNPEHRILQSAILMEYMKGGSLKVGFIDHVPVSPLRPGLGTALEGQCAFVYHGRFPIAVHNCTGFPKWGLSLFILL